MNAHRRSITACMLVFMTGIWTLTNGHSLMACQDGKESIEAAKKSLSEMQSFLRKGQWDDLMVHLSDKGKKSLAIEVCYSLAISGEIAANGSQGLPPGIEELANRIKAISEKYELDEIGQLIFDGKPEEAQKKLEATGRMWEIVDALWKSQMGSAFHVHPAYGDIVASEVDGEAIYFDIEMKPISTPKEEDGIQLDMAGPAQVIRMKQVDGSWKYDGIDEQRTMQRMEKFIAEMGPEGMGMKPPEPLDDPSFSGKTSDGSKISLADYKGKIVILDFWGTWCGPCVAAMPKMKMIREAFAKHGVEIIGVAVDRTESVAKLCKKNEIPWPNVVDPEGKLADHFGVVAFPTLMVIDKSGKHVHADIEKEPLVKDLIIRLGLDEKNFEKLLKKVAEKDGLPEAEEAPTNDT